MNDKGDASAPSGTAAALARRPARLTLLPARAGLRIEGDLDVAVLPSLRRALDRFGDDDIEVDLSGLTFVDVGCLRALVAAADRLPEGNVLTLWPAPRHLRLLLELTGWHAQPRLLLRDTQPSLISGPRHRR
ncbi:STAS domain-containing protein [Sphaerisporangium sp. TRM90804]|uniref:STAS domain-containing protein n=1 Tax=Sphaerisporangium sp. TRM90804 TaxID=3031113 RepID=UPI00244725B3|nr:STAS domain-containing protein [Sphaerisporangium sp. TRM90804]MDH2426185.1 STAS domain-containing protein [Sphaerisporangium sp. TRM90804]